MQHLFYLILFHFYLYRMSSGLMSCVRENSPPLELDLCASGPLSLPLEGNSRSHGYRGPTTSTPIASPVATEDGNSSTNVGKSQLCLFDIMYKIKGVYVRRYIIIGIDTSVCVCVCAKTVRDFPERQQTIGTMRSNCLYPLQAG